MGVTTTLAGGRWEDIIPERLDRADIDKLKAIYQPKILSVLVLKTALGTNKAKFVSLGIDYEVDINGNRRCVWEENGKRCRQYDKQPLCERHIKMAIGIGNFIASTQLRDVYNKLMTSPQRMQCDSELAMMRLMLIEITKKIRPDGDTPLELIAAITTMSEKITTTVERISKMQAITPEHIEKMQEAVITIMAEYIPPEKLEEVASKIAGMMTTREVVNIPYEPGDKIMVDAEFKTIESSPLKRALQETALRMDISG